MRVLTRLLAPISLAAILAACSTGGPPSASTGASGPASPSAAASPSASADPCAADSLETKTEGKLTIGADNPAFPPYYDPEPADPDWELGNPKNGKGLEGATAAAVAEALGFEASDVVWVPVPFTNAIQPGEKDFDLYLTQVSYSAERAQAVDLSDGYFDVTQSVVALEGTPIASAKSVADLKQYKLGTQVGTTSYTYITDNIQPTQDAAAYDSLDAALSALNAKQIDGIVIDLPTAFYMRDAQLEGGTIVGQLPTVGEAEHFSIVLDKDSPLTECVNAALAELKADGTLDDIREEWITSQGAPELE